MNNKIKAFMFSVVMMTGVLVCAEGLEDLFQAAINARESVEIMHDQVATLRFGREQQELTGAERNAIMDLRDAALFAIQKASDYRNSGGYLDDSVFIDLQAEVEGADYYLNNF